MKSRGVVNKHSGRVGVVTHAEPDLSAPYFSESLRGVSEGVVGWNFMVNPSVDFLVDGLIFLAPEDVGFWWKKALSDGLPAVVMNGTGLGGPSVDLDNVRAAESVVTHLIASGRRRVAVINGKMETANGTDRRSGARRALEQAGIPLNPAYEFDGRFDRDSGRRAMEQFLSLPVVPNAVFAANDAMALGALAVLSERGLRVPEDVVLAGFDDDPEAATKGLTSLRQPVREMACQARVLLLDWIKTGKAPTRERILFQGVLLTRESTKNSQPPMASSQKH